MRIRHIKTAVRDKRGKIIDILENIPIEYVTVISSKMGAIRGNHYHKKSVQYVYVLKGRMKIFSQMPGERIRTYILRPGDLACNPPMERHAITTLEDTDFLVFTRGPRGGKNYEKDTHRIKKRLA